MKVPCPRVYWETEHGLESTKPHWSRSDLSNLITNVTLTTTPALITRQRRNAASALARGFEFTGRHDWGAFHGELGYLFADSRVATRERIAELPKHRGSAQLSYVHKGTVGRARVSELQFAVRR